MQKPCRSRLARLCGGYDKTA